MILYLQNRYNNFLNLNNCLYNFNNIITKNIIIVNLLLIINNIFCILFLLINYVYYKCTHKISYKLIILFRYFSINCGVIYIKIIQWVLTKEDILNIEYNNLEILKNVFTDVFDNCYYHHYNYSYNILKNEFFSVLDNNYIEKNLIKNLNIKNSNSFDLEKLFINVNSISSGSIAQIYEAYYYDISNNYNAFDDDISNGDISKNLNNNIKKICIKIVHPNIYLQCFWTNLFLNILYYISYLFTKNQYLFNIPFDYKNLYNSFLNQCNMINEYENIIKFYYNYFDNEYIIIPKPLYANKNILIMEYQDGEKIDNINNSQYVKNKIMLLLNLFNNNCILNQNIFHCDLHEGNWKIQKYNNFYKLVVYDFGYCQNFTNNNNLKQFMYSWMTEDIDNIISYSSKIFIKINIYEREKIFQYARTYLKNLVGRSINFLHIAKLIIKISKKYNCKINNEPFNIILSFMLIEKNLKKFYIIKDEKSLNNIVTREEKYNNIKQNCYSNIAFCNEYHIFYKMMNFYQEFIYINDDKFENNFSIRKKNNIKKNNTKKYESKILHNQNNILEI
jgi:predicted unusual protein kinase regulating ubiquinone biosynthesis (AarF/ABC1/UbiB family)